MNMASSQFVVPSMRRATIILSAASLAALGGSNRSLADPGMTNLAAGKTANSTRSDFGGTPEKGVDGNRDGNFNNGSVFYENADPTAGGELFFFQNNPLGKKIKKSPQFLPPPRPKQAPL